MHFEAPEIVEHEAAAAAEHLDALLAEIRMPARNVHEHAKRSIGEGDGDTHVVRIALAVTHRAGGAHVERIRPGEPAHEVEEVHTLAGEPSAALHGIAQPVLRRKR